MNRTSESRRLEAAGIEGVRGVWRHLGGLIVVVAVDQEHYAREVREKWASKLRFLRG